MDVSFNGISRLVSFIDRIEKDTYPEEPTPLHGEIIEYLLNSVLPDYGVGKNIRVLDVGCGQGPALDILRANGYTSLAGITLNDEDVRVCKEKGHNVCKMDQSFLTFPDACFGLLWARHVVEHSVFPYFTLTEFARVLSAGALLYLEVPAPETACRHETNPNHYSVLGRSLWMSLLGRSGFSIVKDMKFTIDTKVGPDEYWGFICRKGE